MYSDPCIMSSSTEFGQVGFVERLVGKVKGRVWMTYYIVGRENIDEDETTSYPNTFWYKKTKDLKHTWPKRKIT